MFFFYKMDQCDIMAEDSDEGMDLNSADESDDDIGLDPIEPTERGATGDSMKEYNGIGER